MNVDRKHKRETKTQYLKLMEQFGLVWSIEKIVQY